MDSREAAERARLAETFLFRGAPPEAVELARTDPRTVRQENGKGGVIYAPHAFRRCLGVVLEGRHLYDFSVETTAGQGCTNRSGKTAAPPARQ